MNFIPVIARSFVFVSLLGLASGCHRTTPAAEAASQGVLLYANGSEPSDLDPHTNISGDTQTIFSALFEGLVTRGLDGHDLHPGVAQSWDTSSDGLIYSFHLRRDARWSNGAPVTADDFLFSFRRLFDPLLANEAASFAYMIAGSEDYNSGKIKDPATLGLSAPDPLTFVIRLNHPTSLLLPVLAIGAPFLPIYRPAVEKFDGVHRRNSGWTRPGELISNGAFQLTEWKPDRVITLTRNPYYWDGAHLKIQGVRFFPIDNADAQERGFRAGQFHVTTNFPAVKRASYTAQPGPLQIGPGGSTYFVTFNVARFPDVRVRRALSLAIDRRPIVAAVLGSLAEPARTYARPGLGHYVPPDSPACRFDPVSARALLAAAGYPEGRKFPPIDLMLIGNGAETVRMGEAVQESWNRVLGIQTHLQPTEMKVYLDAERTQHYTAIIEQWGPPWDDPTAILQLAQSGNPNNDSGWSDPRFDAAYRLSERLPNGPERKRAFDQQEAVIAEQVPYAPLYYPNLASLVSPLLRGWVNDPFHAVDWKGLSFDGPP